MAGNDNVLFTNLQRSLSTDYNDLQSMAARSLADIFKHLVATKNVESGAGTSPSSSPSSCVLSGLLSVPNGTQVNVTAGALMQDSAALLPVPGSLDSTYRLAYQRATETLTPPAPGGDTWYLLEAQMTEVDSLLGNRDVFNPATGVFTPAAVTLQQEHQIAYQFTAGTINSLPAVTVDFVPLAAVFRPAGGGAVLSTHIIDLRPLWQQFIGERATTTAEPQAGTVTRWGLRPTSIPLTLTTLAELDLEGELDGQRLFARTDGAAVDLSGTEFHESGLVFPAAASIFYLYLVPVLGGVSAPTGQHADLVHRGALVLSLVAPNLQRTNGAVITMGAAPFTGATVAAGGALYVGALLSAAGGIESQWCSVDGEHRLSSDGALIQLTTLSAAPSFQDVNFDTDLGGGPVVPGAAYEAIISNAVGTLAVAGNTRAAVGVTGVVGIDHDNGGVLLTDISGVAGREMRAPVGLSRLLRTSVLTPNIGVATIAFQVMGWRY
jgi:hypothetical protein